MQLSHSGQALCDIVIAPDASAVEHYAATTLQSYLHQITGASFTLRTSADIDLSHPVIAVGPGAAQLVDPQLDLSLRSLGQEGIILRTSGRHLILSGADSASRGTLYAVYTLLQQLGCRWWSPRDSRIPTTPDLSVAPQQIRYIPPLEYREIHEIDAFNPDWAERNRINGDSSPIPADHGGHVIYAGPPGYFVHTFELLVPPKTWFPVHPEWFSMIDGRRIGPPNYVQLCLTNKELLEFVKKRVREIAAQVPPDTDAILSVSQNDNSAPCQCESCRKLAEYEGSESGPLIHFVNAIADDIRHDYPRIAIDTLAYRYTRKPPLHVRPRDNVIIRLCDIECSFAQPLTDPVNKSFAEDVLQWSKLSNRLYIWDYIVNFANYIQPHPNLYVLGPNVRFFVDNGAKGVYEQGNRHSPGGDFAVLRQWVLAQLLWNPSLDGRQLIAQFLKEYYEAASDDIARYIDLRHQAAKDVFVGISDGYDSPWLTPEFLAGSYTLLEQARARVSSSPQLAARVELLQAPVLYAIVRNWRRKVVWQRMNRPWPLEHDKGFYLDQLARILRENNVTALSEGRFEGDVQKWIDSLRHEPVDVPPPPAVAQLPRGDWYDLQDRDFLIVGESKGQVSRINDPQASDGSAVAMPGDHQEWAIQPKPDALIVAGQPDQPWTLYAAVRVEAGADRSGNAFACGVYDNANGGHPIPPLTIPLSRIPDEKYHWYRIGSLPFKHTQFIWFAPVENKQVQRICIDRLMFIRGDVNLDLDTR